MSIYLFKAIKNHKEDKQKWSKEKSELQEEISDLKSKLVELKSSSQGQLTEMKRDMDELMAVSYVNMLHSLQLYTTVLKYSTAGV